MRWFAKAPSNIALIKYMGKSDEKQNQPANPSLSYTLTDRLSFVEIEAHGAAEDYWEPLVLPGLEPIQLSEAAQKRFLCHLMFLKKQFNSDRGFIVRSSNNFPYSAGLASSASSFAALTQCGVQALAELTQSPLPTIDKMADLSRHGSGSSCRSFYQPWSIWDHQGPRQLDLPYANLIHHVVLLDREVKQVSSSEAHRRVKSSPIYSERLTQVTQRLDQLVQALTAHNWSAANNIAWSEFQQMHRLFATAVPAFHYLTQTSQTLLRHLQQYWQQHHDGPIVTVDAGPNIHLLFRPDQDEMATTLIQGLRHDYDVI